MNSASAPGPKGETPPNASKEVLVLVVLVLAGLVASVAYKMWRLPEAAPLSPAPAQPTSPSGGHLGAPPAVLL